MRLADFRPRSSLRVPATHVARPRFPVVDAHNHLGPIFGGEWADRPVAELLAAMDEAGVAALVDLDGGGGDALSRAVERTQAAYPGRFAVFAGLAYDAWRTEPAFGELEAERLRDAARRGARGLKVWKQLGLVARDADRRLVAVDDPRLDPLWRTAGELELPVTIHVADPVAFFAPLGPENERYEELQENPDWHVWPLRDPARADDPDAPGFPPFDALLAALDRVLTRHPTTTFIGAHVGCAPEDLALVSGMLERHPRYHVDLAARLAELGRQPYTARTFFLRWADRILYGTDHPTDPADHRLHARFLETWDESFDYGLSDPPGQGRWQICGLGLPDEVLRRVYAENARRLIRFD